MIKNNAVLATVAFALVVTVSSVSYTFYQLYQVNRTKHIDNIFTKHSLISQIYHPYIIKQISEPMFEANLALYDLEEISDEGVYETIIRQGKILKSDGNGDEVMEEYTLSDAPFETHLAEQVITSMIEYRCNIYFF